MDKTMWIKTNSFALLIYLEKMKDKPECPVIKFPVVHTEIQRNIFSARIINMWNDIP